MVEEQCRGREVAPFPLGRSRFIWEERGQGGGKGGWGIYNRHNVHFYVHHTDLGSLLLSDITVSGIDH